MAANEGIIKAVVNFYQDDSDAVFLGLSSIYMYVHILSRYKF